MEAMMARTKRTPKALKAKVTARTAPKRKAKKRAKPTCPIVTALEGQRTDIKRYEVLCDLWRETPATAPNKERLADQCRTIRDVISSRWEAISYLHPQSLTGAIYLLLLGYADFSGAHEITDNDLRAKQRRRARRCQERGIEKLCWLPASHMDIAIMRWLMPVDETEWTRRYYAKQKADELIAAED
jgi:hypothetical protein